MEREKSVRVAARLGPRTFFGLLVLCSFIHSHPRVLPFATLPSPVSFTPSMDVVEKAQSFLSNWSKSGEADWYVLTLVPLHTPFGFCPSPLL